MEEVEKNELKTERRVNYSKMAILVTTIYSVAAHHELLARINKVFELKNNSKVDLARFQFLQQEVQRYLEILQRNLYLIAEAAKSFFLEPNEEFYSELAQYLRQKRLPFEVLLRIVQENPSFLPGEPEFQIGLTTKSSGKRSDVFVSRREQRTYIPVNDSAKRLTREMLKVIKGNNKK